MINYNLHEKALKNTSIPKVNFYNHVDFVKSDEKLFVGDIKKIILLYSINSETTGINDYKNNDVTYSEINIFQILLKSKKNVNKISKILFTLILEPCLLEFRFGDEVCFSVAVFRANKNKETKNIVEQIYTTQFLEIKDDWIKNLDLNKFNWSNASLYKLHQYLMEKIIIKILNDAGISTFDSIENGLEKLSKLEVLQMELKKLETKIKSTQQFNKKNDLIDEKKKIEIKINALNCN